MSTRETLTLSNRGETLEKPKDAGKPPAGDFAFWEGEMKLAEGESRQWFLEGDATNRRHLDVRGTQFSRITTARIKRFNILWANTRTLLSHVFQSIGKPVVQRRHLDKDPDSRAAAQILERALNFMLDDQDGDYEVKRAVIDRLLPGRGTCRVIYEPHFGETLTDENNEEVKDDQGDPVRELIYSEVRIDHHYWKDFFTGPARKWSEVPWVCFRSYMTLAAMEKRFGKEKAARVQLNADPSDSGDSDPREENPAPSSLRKATIWEIWNLDDRKTYWISPDFTEGALDVESDPLNLKGFFPCPRPMYATLSSDSMIPKPDYFMYLDQALQLDLNTQKIATLTRAVKVAGFYPGEEKGPMTRIFQSDTNKLIPIIEWQKFIEKGGAANMISWLPIDVIVQTISTLQQRNDQIKQDIFEISGISDIFRGQTDPNETLGAQRLKGQFAGAIIEEMKQDIERHNVDLIQLCAEVMAELFDSETLFEMSEWENLNADEDQDPLASLPQDQLQQLSPEQRAQLEELTKQRADQRHEEQFERGLEILRNDGVRRFSLTIENESALAVDAQQEKENRSQFLTAMATFLREAIPAVEQNPVMADLLLEMLHFAMRGFKVGRELEAAYEATAKKLRAAANQAIANPQPEPSDAQVKAQTEQGKQQIQGQKVQGELQIGQTEAQASTTRANAEMLKAQTDQAESRADIEKLAFDRFIEQAELVLKQEGVQIEKGELARRMRADELEFQVARENAALSNIEGDI